MGYWIIYVLCVPVLAVNLIGITAIAGKMGELDKVVGELRVGEGIGEGIGEGRDLGTWGVCCCPLAWGCRQASALAVRFC